MSKSGFVASESDLAAQITRAHLQSFDHVAITALARELFVHRPEEPDLSVHARAAQAFAHAAVFVEEAAQREPRYYRVASLQPGAEPHNTVLGYVVTKGPDGEDKTEVVYADGRRRPSALFPASFESIGSLVRL